MCSQLFCSCSSALRRFTFSITLAQVEVSRPAAALEKLFRLFMAQATNIRCIFQDNLEQHAAGLTGEDHGAGAGMLIRNSARGPQSQHNELQPYSRVHSVDLQDHDDPFPAAREEPRPLSAPAAANSEPAVPRWRITGGPAAHGGAYRDNSFSAARFGQRRHHRATVRIIEVCRPRPRACLSTCMEASREAPIRPELFDGMERVPAGMYQVRQTLARWGS